MTPEGTRQARTCLESRGVREDRILRRFRLQRRLGAERRRHGPDASDGHRSPNATRALLVPEWNKIALRPPGEPHRGLRELRRLVMDADGSGPASLTNSAVSDDDFNNPGGHRRAEDRFRTGDGQSRGLLNEHRWHGRCDADVRPRASEIYPTWSPDGTKIAFVSDRDGDMEIYTMNTDGTGQVKRTKQGGPIRRRRAELVTRRDQDRLRKWPREELGHLHHEPGRLGAEAADHRPAKC